MTSDTKNTLQPDEPLDREFGLTSLALRNRTTVFFLTFLIVVVGILTYIGLPKENFPEIEQPTVYIGTSYPGNSPLDIENLITRPIEKELNSISNVDNIRSTSVQDYSTIIVEFTTSTELSDALQKVKDAVDKSKPELPSDLKTEPNVFELNFSEFPVMNINLSGDFTLDELKKYAEYLEEEIEKFPEISKCEIRGVDEKEVKIRANPYEMEARNVSFGMIAEAISGENVTLSGGSVLSDGVRRDIRVVGEFNDPKQLEDVVVKHEDGNIVYLRDIATVEFEYKEKQNYARLMGEQVVMVDVIKRSGENLLILTDKIMALLDHAQENVFPKDLNLVITNDQSQQTRDMVSSLENNIISGVILVVLVLLFFLGSRNSLFVGVAIPLSMFMSFLILGAFGISINMMVLFSLIMALGMLVDNGIVVVENVYRLMEEGFSALEATRKGVGEVAMPIIASTATTLAAFLPLAFWPGIMGQFMKYLPITLIVTLGSSLFVALVINPVLISTFMKLEGTRKPNYKRAMRIAGGMIVLGIFLLVIGFTAFGNLFIAFGLLTPLNMYVLSPLSQRFQKSVLPVLEGHYRNFVGFALKGWNPYYFFWGTVGLLILSMVLLAAFPLRQVFFPINEPKYVNVFIEFPVGTDIETTNTFAQKMENKVMKFMEPYEYMVESIVANVGQGTSDPNDPSAVGQADSPHKARITVNFVEFKFRQGTKTSDVMEKLRKEIAGSPGVLVTVDKDAAGPPTGKPINIEVVGQDFPTLIALTDKMKNFINDSGIEGIERLKMDLETGKPELVVNIDREKARRFGLSTYTIADEVRTALFGKEISKFKQGKDDYEIYLRLDDNFRYDVDALMNKSIVFRNQTNGRMHQVPISAVAKAEFSSTYGSVRRKDLNRVITLSSNVLGEYNPTAVNDQIKKVLEDFEMPQGYYFKFGGEQEKQEQEMAFLSKALMLAVFLIFLIIVSQFNKLTAPIIIMTTVVFSTIGVLLGLVIFRMEFVIMMTMVGIISLAGIVVNNAIVLIDFIELIRMRKREEVGGRLLHFDEIIECVVEAGRTRLRPVLLTAITTILGLIPLAIGLNIDFITFFSSYDPDFYMGGDNVIFWGPMSWTIIFGLTFATFLTLVIVPVMYLFFARINRKLGIS
jgi:multidrug efflux pump